MKKIVFLHVSLVALAVLFASDARAWGAQGHAAIGQTAVARLSPQARARVMEILGAIDQPALDEALAESCSWPDVVREEPEWAWSAPLHYVNIPRGAGDYRRERDCPDGLCVTEGILRYAAELERSDLGDGTPQAGDRERLWQAFAWVCHLVADLHQPLHAGFADDRGANTVEVEYLGEPMNLHHFWDSALAADRLETETSWYPDEASPGGGDTLPRWSPEQVALWTEESHALTIRVAYPPQAVITEVFAEASWSVVRQRWWVASQRLAMVLEAVLAPRDPDAGSAARTAPGIAQRSRAMRKPMRASWRSGNAEVRKAEREWSGELAQYPPRTTRNLQPGLIHAVPSTGARR
jgi:hypothetical protein